MPNWHYNQEDLVEQLADLLEDSRDIDWLCKLYSLVSDKHRIVGKDF